MERIRALIAEGQRYISQLNPRERLLIAAAGVCFVVFVSSIVISEVNASLRRHEESIADKTTQLQKVAIYAQTFAASERARKDLERSLGGPEVRLMSTIQGFAEKRGLTVGSMNDRGDQNLDQVKESLVELQISAAPIDKLTDLLNDIEHNPQPIKVRKMHLRTGGADPKALNVDLTVGTYKLIPKS